jgi:hypothetical protein
MKAKVANCMGPVPEIRLTHENNREGREGKNLCKDAGET